MGKGMKLVCVLLLALLIAAAAGRILLSANETDLIIRRGAHWLRNWKQALNIAIPALAAGEALLVFLVFRQNKKRKEAQKKLTEAMAPGKLSYAGGRLDEAAMNALIHELSQNYMNDKDSGVSGVLKRAQQQMTQMNEHQARLHKILKMNGASDLNEAEEMLDSLEQNLFENLRKAINWINSSDGAPDQEIMDRLNTICRNNDSINETASKLVRELTNYINHQGDSSYAATQVKSFIENLQEMIKQREE